MTVQTSLLFVCGLGYSGQALARHAIKTGWSVSGTVRSAEKAKTLQAEGISANVWAGEGLLGVPDGAHLVITLPPDEAGCPAARACRDGSVKPASVTYLSTTGVYGDLSGGWAFEWSEVNPSSERAKRRVVAEQQWLDQTDGQARLVRLPGIYGPGRSPLDRLRSGSASRIFKPGQVFSRVHVEDIAAGLTNLLERPETQGVFHLCDDEPAAPHEVIEQAAHLLGMETPTLQTFAEADLSPMARSFYSECKRISNARTKSALGWRPVFKDYRAGLAHILRDDQVTGG